MPDSVNVMLWPITHTNTQASLCTSVPKLLFLEYRRRSSRAQLPPFYWCHPTLRLLRCWISNLSLSSLQYTLECHGYKVTVTFVDRKVGKQTCATSHLATEVSWLRKSKKVPNRTVCASGPSGGIVRDQTGSLLSPHQLVKPRPLDIFIHPHEDKQVMNSAPPMGCRVNGSSKYVLMM